MKRFKRWGLLGLFVIVSLASITPASRAVENESFGLTPHPEQAEGVDRTSFSIPLEEGAEFEDAIRIYNRTDQPIELAVYAADAQADVDTAVSIGPRESQPKGVGSWIDLDEDQVTIQGRSDIAIIFRVKVKSSDPSPDLGAIVVENTGRGLAEDASDRLSLVVRTAPPNSPSTSVRVKSLLRLDSPWVIVAIVGLLVALVVIVIGTRRARRTKDVVVPVGDIEQHDEESDAVQEASRPVIRRLGERPAESRPNTKTSEVPVVRDGPFSTAESVVDDRPMLDDDMLVEVDDVSEDDLVEDEAEDEEYLPPAGSRQATTKAAKPAARKASSAKSKPRAKPAAKRKPKKVVRKAAKKPTPRSKKFIPLDDL